MKTFRLFSILTLLFMMVFIVQCSKDETVAPLVKLSGKVTFTNGAGETANAAGAIVYLAQSATATTVYDHTTIADANGAYTFANLPAGTYYVNSTYYTDNKNVTGRLDGLNFTTEAGAIVTVASADIAQDLSLISIGQSGTTIQALQASYAWNPNATPAPAYVNTGTWTFDAAHSPVQFEFPYRGNEADFVGGFSQVSKFNVNFDPANLAASTIDVEVDLASVNTRTPGGRDNRTTVADNPTFSSTTQFTELGCIAGTFGITADVAVPTDGAPQTITADPDRYAKFTSTSIVKLGDGYVAKGNLIFHGFTVPVQLWFKAVPVWLDSSNSRNYSGFEGRFTMNAKGDFGIVSSSVNDAIIKIQISVVLYKL